MGVNTWEYKLQEFTGSMDAFRALVTDAKTQAWEIGALLPSQSKAQAHLANPASDGSAASTICIIFKRQLPTIAPATSFP